MKNTEVKTGFDRKKNEEIAAGEISAKVKEVLMEKVDEFVADSIIRVNCKRIGLAPEKIISSSLDILADKIGISLLIFLPEKESLEIVSKIKEIK